MPMTGLMPASRAASYSRSDAVHVAVVGDADRRLAVGGRRRDDLADPRRTVEHRVLGVQVQMDEGIGHAYSAGRVVHRACGRPCGQVTSL